MFRGCEQRSPAEPQLPAFPVHNAGIISRNISGRNGVLYVFSEFISSNFKVLALGSRSNPQCT